MDIDYQRGYRHKETGIIFFIKYAHRDYLEMYDYEYGFTYIGKPNELENKFSKESAYGFSDSGKENKNSKRTKRDNPKKVG